jgi:hypothetical protein
MFEGDEVVSGEMYMALVIHVTLKMKIKAQQMTFRQDITKYKIAANRLSS